MHMDISQKRFYARILTIKCRAPGQENVAEKTLCEPAQSKRTWTPHKSNFTREFTAKMPEARERTLI